jgi:hypothetical protein
MNQVRDIVRRFFDGRPEKLIEIIIQDEIKQRDQLEMAKTLVDSRLAPIMVMEMRSPQPPRAAT